MQPRVITDRDAADADQVAELAGLPHPSYVGLNPHPTAGHIVYTLVLVRIVATVPSLAEGLPRPVRADGHLLERPVLAT